MTVYVGSLQGIRPSNEDNHIVFKYLNNDINTLKLDIFGVFDGHGGKAVSEYLKHNYIKYFTANITMADIHNSKKFVKLISRLYNIINNNLMKEHPRLIYQCGSTACIVIRYKGITHDKIWVINVGDSRAIKCNHLKLAEQLSNDHKPNTPTELERINKLGGKIEFDGSDWRVCDLSVSRAFGDIASTPYITHLPEIYRYKLNKRDKFIIVACDGLWDIMSNQDAVNYILHLQYIKYTGNYAKSLAEYAIKKGSCDNVTVIVYFIDNL